MKVQNMKVVAFLILYCIHIFQEKGKWIFWHTVFGNINHLEAKKDISMITLTGSSGAIG